MGTNSSQWYIERQSQTISLHFEEQTNGTVAPINITPHGRAITGYYSRYANVDENDVMLKERTSARRGSLMSAEVDDLLSSDTEPVAQYVKASGTNHSELVEVDFAEYLPVYLKSQRHVYYSGSEINDRDFGGNNWDYVGRSSLYNQKFEQLRTYRMVLNHLNVSVVAVSINNSGQIKSVDWLPSDQILYKGQTYSTGITDIKYGQASENQLSTIKGEGRISYDNIGEQRYYGRFITNSSLNLKSWEPIGPDLYNNYDWLEGVCDTCRNFDGLQILQQEDNASRGG